MSDVPSFDTVELVADDGVAVLALNRPDRANTVTNTLIREFEAALDWVARTRQRVLVVTARGKHFCAGADLKPPKGDGARLGDVAWINRLEELRIPVIAAINGPAIGGGLELAMACDVRVIAADAKVSLPEARFGGLPAGGGTQRLPRIVGTSRAKLLMWLGTELSAAEAERIGLVDLVVPAEDLMAEVKALTAELVTRPAYALEAVKFLVTEGVNSDQRTGMRTELQVARRLSTDAEKAAARDAVSRTDANYRKIFAGPSERA